MTPRKCPICGLELKGYSDVLDGWLLMEDVYSCEKGHYSYEYHTGYYEIRVGQLSVSWNHNTLFEKVERCEKVADKLVERYKRKNLIARKQAQEGMDNLIDPLLASTKELIALLTKKNEKE